MTSQAQDIKIGDVIHLKSKFQADGVDQFLDTQGRVMDYHKEQAKSHNLIAVTNKTNNRDNGSGSWKIISHSKKDENRCSWATGSACRTCSPTAATWTRRT